MATNFFAVNSALSNAGKLGRRKQRRSSHVLGQLLFGRQDPARVARNDLLELIDPEETDVFGESNRNLVERACVAGALS